MYDAVGEDARGARLQVAGEMRRRRSQSCRAAEAAHGTESRAGQGRRRRPTMEVPPRAMSPVSNALPAVSRYTSDGVLSVKRNHTFEPLAEARYGRSVGGGVVGRAGGDHLGGGAGHEHAGVREVVVAGEATPRRAGRAVGAAVAAAPQLALSVWNDVTATHSPPALGGARAAHHAASARVAGVGAVHARPHMPQLARLLCVSTQADPQMVRPVGQRHMPPSRSARRRSGCRRSRSWRCRSWC